MFIKCHKKKRFSFYRIYSLLLKTEIQYQSCISFYCLFTNFPLDIDDLQIVFNLFFLHIKYLLLSFLKSKKKKNVYSLFCRIGFLLFCKINGYTIFFCNEIFIEYFSSLLDKLKVFVSFPSRYCALFILYIL